MSGRDHKKRTAELLALAGQHGFDCAPAGKRNPHTKIKAPDGALYVAGSTPSDWRGPRNLRSWLIRHGLPRERVR